MVGHHFCPVRQPFSREGMLISPITPKGNVTHLCWSHSAVSHCSMQITIWIIENIQFSGLGLYQREMSRTTGVSQDAIYKVLRCVRESSSVTQGLRGHLFKTITSKEDHALLRISRRKSFLSGVQNPGGADQANWTPCRCPHGPRTFGSGWTSLNHWRHPDRCPRLTHHHRCRRRMLVDVPQNWNHQHGPLTRYVKLQVALAPGMPGTFSPAADFKGNR